MPYFFDPSEVERRELVPGLSLRTMWGDKVMMSLVEIAPRAVLPACRTSSTRPRSSAGSSCPA